MRPIAEGLFTDENPATPDRRPQPRDRADRLSVPAGAEFEPYPLKRDGTLWSYTIQRYRPKSPPYAGPEAFRPWPVAYIALEGETIVEARLANVEFDAIEIGMKLEMVPIPLDPDTAICPISRPSGLSEKRHERRCLHCRHRHPSLWSHRRAFRGSIRAYSQCAGDGGCGRRLDRHAVRLWRVRRGGQSRYDG